MGGFSKSAAAGAAVSAQNIFGGGIVGMDAGLGGSFTAGAFGGAALGKTDIANGSNTINSTTALAGLYASYNDWIDMALAGGATRNVGDRLVLNNLVVGGIETAHAEYNSIFISPEVTLKGERVGLGGITVRPTVRGRYTYQHFDGYSETGSTANITVGARDTHTFDGRLQLDFGVVDTSDTQLVLRLGVDGRVVQGANAVDATMLGNAFNFDPGGNANSVGGFAGASFDRKLSDTTNIFATAEVGMGTGTAIRANADAGIRVKF
jgi:hypothetical protein